MFIEHHISSTDGKRIYCRDYGSPYNDFTPLLCLSGLVRNSLDFHDMATRYAQMGFRVVAMDYRGRGQSDYDDEWEHYMPSAMIGDVFAVLDALQLHKVVFVGTSLGGLLSMAIAALQPTRVAAVVMNDIGPQVNDNGLERIKDYVGKDYPQNDWTTATKRMKEMFPKLRLSEDEWTSMTKATFKKGKDGLLHHNWDLNIAKTIGLKNDTDPDLWDLFKSLKPFPTLAIRGAVSDVLSEETFDKMARIKPDLMRVVVKDVGHCPSYADTQIQESLDALLKQVNHI